MIQSTRKLLRLCLCAVLCIAAPGAHAQLTVDDFSRRINDMSGRSTEILRNEKMRDNDGNLLALIKVFGPRMDGFSFYGGAQSGFLTAEAHGGEIWVFVPSTSQRITISHAVFGRIEYEYDVALQQGATYQMLLNVGGGRFVNINSTGAPNARVSINGRYVGETPIYNHYMPYGHYQVTAVKDRFEGQTDIDVVKASEGDRNQQSFNIPMVDQTPHYGDVNVTVEDDPHSEIFYEGERVGAGTWRTMLKEGIHEVVTRKADCDSSLTRFNVVAQTENEVRANAPVPHTGNVLIYTRPRSAKATYDGKPIDLTDQRVLPVGTHQFLFTKSGYENLEKDIVVRRGATVVDTLELSMTNYVKNKWGFYFGAGYTMTSLSGLTGYLGGVVSNIDLQLSYTLGLKQSDKAYAYTYDPVAGHALQGTNRYKMNALAARLGYQFRPIPRLGLTPQVGYMQQILAADAVDEGSDKFADGARASSLTVGLKVLGVPVKHLYLFLTPEYAIPLKRDNAFKQMAAAADFSAGGFSVSAGILVSFGNK